MLLITGGNGFLGKHIQKYIKGRFVAPSSLKIDLLKKDNFVKYIQAIRPRKILHLAGNCGGIRYNKDNPARLLYDNIQMAINVFEAARVAGVDEVITIGSTCQYPAALTPPFKVDNMWDGLPEETNGGYGLAKRMMYEMGQAYMSQYGINHKHIILANLYGPGDSYNKENSHVIPSLIVKVIEDLVVNVWGDGKSKREFLYVVDAAKIISNLLSEPFSGAVNVGSNEVIAIHDLILLIQKILGQNRKISYSMELNGQRERLLDSQYKGTTTLADGLTKTIKAYKQTLTTV